MGGVYVGLIVEGVDEQVGVVGYGGLLGCRGDGRGF